MRGDLLETLDEVVETASAHGTVVVQHSAVIAYLDPPERRTFANRMAELVAAGRVRWISNEGDRVLPEITRTAAPEGLPTERFVLGLDGRAVAWTHGHGASLTWLAERRRAPGGGAIAARRLRQRPSVPTDLFGE